MDIDKLYPEFDKWVHKVKGYATASGVYLIKLWYEWLKERNETTKVRTVS
jgi:hypothetical protein